MEQVIDARLEQDKELIKRVTQQELKRAALRNKISALRNCRERINENNQAVDKQGAPIKGQRKFQEFYVTQQQVTRQVLRRLNFPKEELAQIEAEEEFEATQRAAKTQTIQLDPARQEPVEAEPAKAEPAKAEPAEALDEDRCINVGQDDDQEIASVIAKPANPYAFQRLVSVKRPPVAAPAPVKLDPISKELAVLERQQRQREQQAKEKALRVAAAKAKAAKAKAPNKKPN